MSPFPLQIAARDAVGKYPNRSASRPADVKGFGVGGLAGHSLEHAHFMIVVCKGFARGQKSCADDDALRAPAQGGRQPVPVHNPTSRQDRDIDMCHHVR